MNRLWSKHAKTLDAYVPGEQPKDRSYVKLNTNECPYPPHQLVQEAMVEAVHNHMNLYPDPRCSSLKKEFADLHGLKEENIFVGNGSDEVLAFSFMAFF